MTLREFSPSLPQLPYIREGDYNSKTERIALMIHQGNVYKVLRSTWLTTKTYCIAHGTLLSDMWQPGWEEIWETMDTCMYMTESLHYSPETTTTLSISYAPIQNKKFEIWEKREVSG